MSQTIEVTVSPQGETHVETKGFSGGTCQDVSKLLEAALGVRTSEQLTNEFYETASTEEQLTQQP